MPASAPARAVAYYFRAILDCRSAIAYILVKSGQADDGLTILFYPRAWRDVVTAGCAESIRAMRITNTVDTSVRR